jgi:heptosyltransferase-2
MKHAKMNYVNDSGPLHLASSVNAPTTAFFCSTVPAYGFFPLSYNSQVVEVANLYCKPCGLHGYKACPEGHFKCGKDIELPLFK